VPKKKKNIDLKITSPSHGRKLTFASLKPADIFGFGELEISGPGLTLSADPFDMERSDDYQNEHFWAITSQEFLNVINKDLPREERIDAAIRLYSYMSFAMPMQKGSATAARIILEYSASVISRDTGEKFDIPFIKEGLNLNFKALQRTPENFLKDWKKGKWFDHDVTSKEVIQWQKDYIEGFKR